MDILIRDLPEYIKNSEFYDNLITEENTLISIPLLKLDDEIRNIQDFKEFYRTIDFFGLRTYPKNFFNFFRDNSIEVYEDLIPDRELYIFLLKDLCKLKIKNIYQFYITYKIINYFELNPQEYPYYIEYPFPNITSFLDIKGNYIINNQEFANLARKISRTSFIDFKIIRLADRVSIFDVKSDEFHDFILAELYYTIWIFTFNKEELIENINNLINSIKTNQDHKHKYTFPRPSDIEDGFTDYPSFNNTGILRFLTFSNKKIKFYVNEFNKKNIITSLYGMLKSVEEYQEEDL